MPVIDETVQKNIERLVEREGFELVHLEFRPGAGQSCMRLYIDRPGGVTLDDCQNISRQVSTLLDVDDPIPYRYTLEVSSPGLDRGLYKEADYVRFAGKRVRLTLRQPIDGRRNFRGTLAGVTDGVVRIVEQGTQEWRFDIAAIAKANLEIEL